MIAFATISPGIIGIMSTQCKSTSEVRFLLTNTMFLFKISILFLYIVCTKS